MDNKCCRSAFYVGTVMTLFNPYAASHVLVQECRGKGQ